MDKSRVTPVKFKVSQSGMMVYTIILFSTENRMPLWRILLPSRAGLKMKIDGGENDGILQEVWNGNQRSGQHVPPLRRGADRGGGG